MARLINSDYFCTLGLNSLLKHFNWKLPHLKFWRNYRLFWWPWDSQKRKLVLLLVMSGVLFKYIFVIDLWCISFMHIRIASSITYLQNNYSSIN